VLRIPDLLKETDKRVKFEKNYKGAWREDLPKVPGAFLVHDLLTPHECQQFISISEEMGYAPAPLRVLNGIENDTASMDTTIRNSQRVLYHTPEETNALLCQRLLPLLPKKAQYRLFSLAGLEHKWKVHPSCCINERWRFNRYDKGEYFKPHFDAGFSRSKTEKSLFTFILYLNDVEEGKGGETLFFPEGKPHLTSEPGEVEEFAVVPKAGLALIFWHVGTLSPRHAGMTLKEEGIRKYIIRSDLMYTFLKDVKAKKIKENKTKGKKK